MPAVRQCSASLEERGTQILYPRCSLSLLPRRRGVPRYYLVATGLDPLAQGPRLGKRAHIMPRGAKTKDTTEEEQPQSTLSNNEYNDTMNRTIVHTGWQFSIFFYTCTHP